MEKQVTITTKKVKGKKNKQPAQKLHFGLSKFTFATPVVRRTLHYSQNILLSPTVGYAINQFVGNGMFDPDETGVGNQPVYFDQFMAIYERYRVLGSRIKVYFANTETAATSQMIRVAVLPTVDDFASVTDIDAVCAQPLVKWKVGNAMQNPPITITHTRATNQQFGVPFEAVRDEINYSGLANTNPASWWRWVVAVSNLAESGSINIRILVTIEYDCEFFQMNQQNLSLLSHSNVETLKKIQQKKGK